MIPQSLVFMFTYHCNFNCDHCSVDAGPNLREVTSISVIKSAIDQAYSISTVRMVVFTGGEPTLFLNNLKEGIAYAQTKGFLTRLVTNGWWANTPEKAMGFLRDLVSCGLRELNISYDDFHAPYLENFGGEQNVLNAVQAAQELGLAVLIGSVFHPKARVRTGYLRQLFSDLGITKVQFLEDFVFPLGRAKHKLPKDMFVSDPESIKRACKEAGKTEEFFRFEPQYDNSFTQFGQVIFPGTGHLLDDPMNT